MATHRTRRLRTLRRRMGVAALVAAVIASTAVMTAPGAGAAPAVAGRVVFLDPGHAGVNGPENAKQVPNGRGGTKECQTSGTATARGYTEAAFNFDTVLRIRLALTALGVRSAMSRGDNSSSGPCVDERARTANSLQPDLIVSIHADGGPPAGSGFHVNYSNPPLNDSQRHSATAAQTVRDVLLAEGMSAATYIGSGGLYARADLAGLNLAQYPAVLIELGNMRNPGEAATMETEKGRQFYADAVTAAIVAYLEKAGDTPRA
ncbi:Rv3717 family N-acetylmuramoyl-L-alanine amidase [Mycolicibacterium sp.]|uniref:Rv3717 family N-acetylmuramoyl-L-alanine amidase n=1 Tax=Mycolicibacterium sp. TaxID=2320850 RepID=UPI0037CB6C48